MKSSHALSLKGVFLYMMCTHTHRGNGAHPLSLSQQFKSLRGKLLNLSLFILSHPGKGVLLTFPRHPGPPPLSLSLSPFVCRPNPIRHTRKGTDQQVCHLQRLLLLRPDPASHFIHDSCPSWTRPTSTPRTSSGKTRRTRMQTGSTP